MCEIAERSIMKFVILAILLTMNVQALGENPTLPKESIYQIQSQWRTQDDKLISLKDFRGQPVVLTMVYTGCAHTCPMTISKVEEIAEAQKKAGIQNVKFVLASFDAKKDTPEVLKKYMKLRGLNENRWTFLSASKDTAVRELAVVLGVSYKELSSGDFSHSNVISYLDESGVVKAKIESLTADVNPIVKAGQRN